MPGCKCESCYGLREHMVELTGKDFGLPAAPGHAPVVELVPCDGSYTCGCSKCREEVRALVARGVREAA